MDKQNDRVNRNEYKSNLIEELIDIGFTNIWTTNFDNAVEHNFLQQNILINKVFKDSDLSNIDIHKRINVFKMNGDISNLDGLCTLYPVPRLLQSPLCCFAR